MVAIDRQKAWLDALEQAAVAAVGDAVETAVRRRQTRPRVHRTTRRARRDRRRHKSLGLRRRRQTPPSPAPSPPNCPPCSKPSPTGEISIWHARAIVDCTDPLSRDKARIVADRVLPRARKQTVAQLRRSLKRAVLAVEPKTAAERAKQAHAERTLYWTPLEDGMAELKLIASASEVMTIFNVADAIAKQTQSRRAQAR